MIRLNVDNFFHFNDSLDRNFNVLDYLLLDDDFLHDNLWLLSNFLNYIDRHFQYLPMDNNLCILMIQTFIHIPLMIHSEHLLLISIGLILLEPLLLPLIQILFVHWLASDAFAHVLDSHFRLLSLDELCYLMFRIREVGWRTVDPRLPQVVICRCQWVMHVQLRLSKVFLVQNGALVTLHINGNRHFHQYLPLDYLYPCFGLSVLVIAEKLNWNLQQFYRLLWIFN